MDQSTRDEPRPWNDARARTPVAAGPDASTTANAVQKNPGLGQRWRSYRPSKGMLVWVCLASIALTMLVGFVWGGWVTGASAQKTAQAMSTTAVVDRLAPICVAQFNADPDKAAKLGEMAALNSSQTAKYIQEQGWATITGVETPDRRVADACSKLLLATGP